MFLKNVLIASHSKHGAVCCRGNYSSYSGGCIDPCPLLHSRSCLLFFPRAAITMQEREGRATTYLKSRTPHSQRWKWLPCTLTRMGLLFHYGMDGWHSLRAECPAFDLPVAQSRSFSCHPKSNVWLYLILEVLRKCFRIHNCQELEYWECSRVECYDIHTPALSSQSW